MYHKLKILPNYFSDVITKKKNFEIRKNDRDYQVDDNILLREFDGLNYTGNEVLLVITYVLKNAEKYGLDNNYCIFSWNNIQIRNHCLSCDCYDSDFASCTMSSMNLYYACDLYNGEFTSYLKNN